MQQLKLFFVALQFFTRIPVTGRLAQWVGFEPDWISRATRFFPLIGLLVAGLMSGFLLLALHAFSKPVALALTLAFGVLLTGAFHEDGFADFCDGFGGGQTRERIVEIMRDSRVGAYGSIGVVLLLLLKYAALFDKSWAQVVMALCLAHVLSRTSTVFIMCTLPYVESEIGQKLSAGAVKPVARNLQWLDWFLPVVTAVLVTGICLFKGLSARSLALACGMVAVIIIWMWRTLRTKLGGYTGDTLGATQQLTEVAIFAALSISRT